jgi:hypothetical protein
MVTVLDFVAIPTEILRGGVIVKLGGEFCWTQVIIDRANSATAVKAVSTVAQKFILPESC